MRENFADALEHDDAEEFLRLLEEKTQQIVKVLMPCPAWDLPVGAAILEKLAEVFQEKAREYMGGAADELRGDVKGVLDKSLNVQETQETEETPRGLADKLREMGDKP